MINSSQILKEHTQLLIQTLQNVEETGFNENVSLEIDCENLAKFSEGCHGTEESKKVFTLLHNNGLNKRPAVYWFEIISDHTGENIRSHYEQLKLKIGSRTIPATNNKYEVASKVLYVGKGVSNLSGRMFMHLGYEKNDKQQGLQLCHWDYTGELKGLKIKLNIMYLSVDLKDIAPLYELKLAKELKPILGRHK